ncbi:hypothetical protein BRC95_11655 [Halobacteriales archaeon QS_5_68_33]|nr:MAG: hypothetical protein BRC95_11655 [Halobacteriales archaeon QS_5_68_33]
MFPRRAAPFSPARLDCPGRAGLKGARRSTTAANASTTANVVSEERSEAPESNASGLSRCLQALSCRTL